MWQRKHSPDNWHGDGYVQKIKLLRAIAQTLDRLRITRRFDPGLREAKNFVDRRKDAIIMKELLDE